MKELWKAITGYEGRYRVSNLGNVYSFHGQGLLSPTIYQGYRRVGLSKDDKKKTAKISRLVATAFLSPVQGKNVVNHKNGIKSDDKVSNLEWCTHSENTMHAFRTGLQVSSPLTGDEHPFSTLTAKQVIAMRKARLAGATTTVLAKRFNTTIQNVSNICLGRAWKHIKGFTSKPIFTGHKPNDGTCKRCGRKEIKVHHLCNRCAQQFYKERKMEELIANEKKLRVAVEALRKIEVERYPDTCKTIAKEALSIIEMWETPTTRTSPCCNLPLVEVVDLPRYMWWECPSCHKAYHDDLTEFTTPNDGDA